jgi:nucleoside-diphosphate-sugar epimerase
MMGNVNQVRMTRAVTTNTYMVVGMWLLLVFQQVTSFVPPTTMWHDGRTTTTTATTVTSSPFLDGATSTTASSSICMLSMTGEEDTADTKFTTTPVVATEIAAAIHCDRRTAVWNSLSTVGMLSGFMTYTATMTGAPLLAYAADDATSSSSSPPNEMVVVVAGATGQTGRRIVERLLQATSGGSNASGRISVIGGVRNVEKATKALSESSTVVRGAMIQTVAAVDTTSNVNLRHLDVVMDTVDQMVDTMRGAKALIIATGFVPGNPLKMSQAAHEVDNVGTCRLIDAAKQAGIQKVVMVSSILTNGRGWGQEKSPGFIVTNAFGSVLDEKLVAEKYLRASGLDYTIVRPGGLKAKPPSGALIVSGEDTLNSGEVSRDLVAEVCVASITDPKASNRVLEIIEDEETPPKVFNGLNM